jgi:hypothetical protein
MNTIKRLAIFTAALLLPATGSFAIVVTPQQGVFGQWQLIASIPVGREPSRDTLTFQGFHTDFRSLRFSVANSSMHLNGIVITFDDGTTANIEVRADIHPGTQSGAFDLPGGHRDIHSIDFWHQSVGQFRGPAVVSVFGLK